VGKNMFKLYSQSLEESKMDESDDLGGYAYI
jgi:hypothetical protein